MDKTKERKNTNQEGKKISLFTEPGDMLNSMVPHEKQPPLT
jgi:hypothetical protein